VILEYLEEAYPGTSLFPPDPLKRARVRELTAFLELNVELVARRLYGAAFFGGQVSDGVKALTEKDLVKGIRAFKQLAKFAPYVAGDAFTAADCATAVHLPLVSRATKTIYGADVFADDAAVQGYAQMIKARPSVRRVLDDMKAFQPKT
jgi:glutathione S-transferase